MPTTFEKGHPQPQKFVEGYAKEMGNTRCAARRKRRGKNVTIRQTNKTEMDGPAVFFHCETQTQTQDHQTEKVQECLIFINKLL